VKNRFYTIVLAVLLFTFTFAVHAAISGISPQYYVGDTVYFTYTTTVSQQFNKWDYCYLKYYRHFTPTDTYNSDNNKMFTTLAQYKVAGGSTFYQTGSFVVTESMLSGQTSKSGDFEASMFCQMYYNPTVNRWDSPWESVTWTAKKEISVCGDFVCSAGEYCSDARDLASCTDNMCYEPVCSNGCSQVLVSNGQEDEKCSGSYHCDGSGNCILDNYCGDGICNNGEVPYTCMQDCGKCMTNADCNDSNPSTEDVCLHQASPTSVCKNTPYCGNNVCDNSETCSTCSSDCGACPTGTLVTEVKETTAFGTDSWGIYGQDNYFYQVFTIPTASNIDIVKLRVFDIENPSAPLVVELRYLFSSNISFRIQISTNLLNSIKTDVRMQTL